MYTAQVRAMMTMVMAVRLRLIWNRDWRIAAIRGVATLKVVAVPASRANTASRTLSIR